MWMSHVIWTSHVTHINESGVCRLWIIKHIVSCEWAMTHTYEWVRHLSPASHDTHHVSIRVACLYAGSACRLWVMTPIVNIVLYAKIMIHAPRIKLNLIIFSYLNTRVQNNKTGGRKGGESRWQNSTVLNAKVVIIPCAENAARFHQSLIKSCFHAPKIEYG